MRGNSCPVWKYWLLILTGSGFHSWNFAVSYLIFPVYFSPRPAVLVAEGDGWMSLCSFADRRAGNMSVPDFTLVCVGARVQHSLCTKKEFLGFWRSFSALTSDGEGRWGVDHMVSERGEWGLLSLCGCSHNQAGPGAVLCLEMIRCALATAVPFNSLDSKTG